jgi:L-histidine Nalpha-methyltransferase / hercynylcysteine S-oxide synthase
MPSLVHSFVESLPTGKPARGAYKPQDKAAAAGTIAHVDIIDIRRGTVEASLKEEIHSLFYPHTGPRKLPTLLLYDERGLQLFEKVGLPPLFLRELKPRG